MSSFEPQPFGPFFLLNKIAQGGMAEIFVSKDIYNESDSQLFVIKKLLQSISDDKRFVGMLIDEAKITSLLEHDNIVKIFDIGSIGNDFYIMLEYINGRSLDILIRRMLDSNQSVPCDLVSYIIAMTAKALDYAHDFKDSEGRALNLVHRDVTPGNILLSWDGDVKLADFGIATVGRETRMAKDELAFGKKFYMPPEQLSNTTPKRSADIYSLGAVAFEMLTGRKIFASKSEIELLEMIQSKNPERPSSHNPDLAQADSVILKALAKDPDKRFPKAGDFANDLAGIFPFDKEAPFKLAKLLRETFSLERENDDNTIKISLEALENFREESSNPVKEGIDIENEEELAQKTQLLSKDYEDAKTSFLPKEKMSQIRKSVKADSGILSKPILKIKTKKITHEEFKEIKKAEALIDAQKREWNPEYTMMPIPDKEGPQSLPDTGQTDEPQDDSESRTLLKPLKDKQSKEVAQTPGDGQSAGQTPEQGPDSIEDIIAQRKRAFESEIDHIEHKKQDEPLEKPAEDLVSRVVEIYGPASLGAKVSGLLHKYYRQAIAAFFFAFLLFLVLKFIAAPTVTSVTLKMNPQNPRDISVVIFSNKPNPYEKEIFEKILRTGKDRKYDNLGSINSFLRNEYKRIKGSNLDFLNLSVIGPVIVEDMPPHKHAFFDKKRTSAYFERKIKDKEIRLSDDSVKIYAFFYSKKPEEVPIYPITYKGHLNWGTQIVFLPLVKEDINGSIILLTNRILSVFGAGEKLDSGGNPIFPEGYANPDSNPLFPQQKAEIMARYIPESRESARAAKFLSDTVIGPKTAFEIGWIDKEEYAKLSSVRR